MLMASMFSFLSSWTSNSNIRASRASKDMNLVIGVSYSNKDDIVKGAKMALDELSGSLPYGKVLTIDTKDDEGDINKGILNASEFAENKKLIAVIGPTDSFIALPASSIYEHSKIVMLSPTEVESLTNNGYRHIFRIVPRARVVANSMANYLMSKGVKEITLCYKSGIYSVETINAYERAIEASGISLIDRLPYDVGDIREFNNILSKWSNFSNDGMVFLGDPLNGTPFYESVYKNDISDIVISNHEMANKDTLNLGNKVTSNNSFMMPLNHDKKHYSLKRFIQKYYEKYGEYPSYLAAVGYDSIKVLIEAIKHRNSYIPSDISDALLDIKSIEGILHKYSFEDDGSLVTEDDFKMAVQEVKKGRFNFVGDF